MDTTSVGAWSALRKLTPEFTAEEAQDEELAQSAGSTGVGASRLETVGCGVQRKARGVSVPTEMR